MPDISVLLTTGHRLFNALLMEARLAAQEGDWDDAKARLAECEQRFEAHMRAEETVLYPRLEGRSAEGDTILAQCRSEHDSLRSDLRIAVAACEACDQVGCDACLAHLIEALSRHCRGEEQRLYRLTTTIGEEDLGALVLALSAVANAQSTPDTRLPPDPGLH